jgi:5-methyltetrahydropteroyltriglutamate--homocysteine methyltransferase
MADDFKYHIDHHASLVRPAALEQARRQHAAGELDDAALRQVIDTVTAEATLRLRRLGMLALSDGEYRRRHDLAVVYDAVSGFLEPGPGGPVAELVGTAHAIEVRPVTGTPAAIGRLAQDEALAIGEQTPRSTVIALPSPGFLAGLCATPGSEADIAKVLAEIIRDEVHALAADGIDYVLLRNPALTFLLTRAGRARATSLGLDPAATVTWMLAADNAVVADLAADAAVPEHFRAGLDITTAGAAAGPWDRDAVSSFLGQLGYDRLCVEYPADPKARFPLDLVPSGLVVSLGVVDVSTPDLEEVDELVARIDEAATVLDIDDIAVSTNGGFHAAPGTAAETERAKLQLVEMTARYFWGNEL